MESKRKKRNDWVFKDVITATAMTEDGGFIFLHIYYRISLKRCALLQEYTSDKLYPDVNEMEFRR